MVCEGVSPHNGHTVLKRYTYAGPDLQVLVDTVLAPIGAVVVGMRYRL